MYCAEADHAFGEAFKVACSKVYRAATTQPFAATKSGRGVSGIQTASWLRTADPSPIQTCGSCHRDVVRPPTARPPRQGFPGSPKDIQRYVC
jgi:hypothetical protein